MKRARLRGLRVFLTSSTAQLSGTYLAIIMVMSIGFSLAFYNTSYNQLGRQLPPDSFYRGIQERETTGGQPGQFNPPTPVVTVTSSPKKSQAPRFNTFFQQRIREGRRELLHRLIIINIASLLLGAVVSYLLARRSLHPIEQAMEAQAQFVSDASHELRTPLTAIQASNEVFLRRPNPTVKQAQQLIEQNTVDIMRLKQLSDSLLDLAQHRKTAISFTRVEVQDIVSEAVTQIVAQAAQKQIVVQDETAPLAVHGDRAALAQVLVILLDNAVKYSHANSTISITARQHGKQIFLDVHDTGIGIRASDVPHLFRRFYRADNARSSGEYGGYGLGLAIAKQLVESHHGTITVVSEPGAGSTFTLKLAAA